MTSEEQEPEKSIVWLVTWSLVTRHCLSGGQGRVRTSVDRMGRQIYSLLLLTTQPPVRYRYSLIRDSRTGTLFGSLFRSHFLSQVIRVCGWARRHPYRRARLSTNRTCETRSRISVQRPSCSFRGCIRSIWSWRRDLNPRPSDYKSDALPAELRQPPQTYYYTNRKLNCKGLRNFFSSHLGVKMLRILSLPLSLPSAVECPL